MTGLAFENNKLNYEEKQIDDEVVAGSKTWSSQKIKSELDKKASNSDITDLHNSISELESVLQGKAEKTALGTQVILTVSGDTLYITDK